MVVIVTCKNEKDPFKMKALEWSQAFMVVLVTYKNEDDPKLKAQE